MSTCTNRLTVALVLGLAAANGAIAADRGWIVGTDDRKVVEEHGSPWEAIGQINITYSKWMFRCTGVLIAPNVVLTAAHCLVNPFTKKAFNAGQIHFAVGAHGSTNKGQAVGKCIQFAEGYEYGGKVERRSPALPRMVPEHAFSRDLAAIVLSQPLTPRPADLAIKRDPPIDTALWHAGYARDRRQDLVGHFECRLKHLDRSVGLWLTDCDSNPGADGGPVFVRENGALRVVAILVTGAADNQFTVSVPLTDALNFHSKRDCLAGEETSPGR
jgi:protease YdgD